MQYNYVFNLMVVQHWNQGKYLHILSVRKLYVENINCWKQNKLVTEATPDKEK